MAIEAPLSSYKKKNLLLIIVVLIGLAGWFYYDGYYNSKFTEEHTVDGVPDDTLVWNRRLVPICIVGSVLTAGFFLITKNKKLLADENALNTGNKTIAYDAIESINKTHFDSKGYFVITYKDSSGQDKELKISDRTYDNLGAVLDHVVAKIS